MNDQRPAGGIPPQTPTGGGDQVADGAAVATLLGVHLAEVEARLDAWGSELRRVLRQAAPAGAPAGVPAAAQAPALPAPTPSPSALEEAGPAPEPRVTPLSSYDLVAGLDGWAAQPDTLLGPGGAIELQRSGGLPGIVSDPLPASSLDPAPLLLRLVVTLDLPDPQDSPAPVLRVTNELGEPLSADQPCGQGRTQHDIFLPPRTRRLRFHLLALRPKPGRRFTLRRLDLLAVDAEDHRRAARHAIGAPVIAAMASIPERRAMLADAVASLLLQCDMVRVFLNNYPDIPDFLRHPRIEVRRSQDWDDKGDAGKFGWVEALDAPGYRIVADDDLLFPPDFARLAVAAARRYGGRAFVGLHGVLLRQPITRYHDTASRSALHFGNPLPQDRTVHVLGTNALCYHSALLTMRWAEFAHRNMADIFLANHAQRHAIPMVAMARPRDWVRQNRQDEAFDTIFDASMRASGTGFDTSRVQDALVRRGWPFTQQPTPRPRIVFCLLAAAPQAAAEALESWQAQAAPDFDWILILCALAEDPVLGAWIAGLRLPQELHVFADPLDAPSLRLAKALALAERVGGQLLCLATDEIRFAGGAWPAPLLAWLGGQFGSALFGHRIGRNGVALGRSVADSAGTLPVVALASMPLGAGDVDPRHPDGWSSLADWLGRLGQLRPAKPDSPEPPAIGSALRHAAGARPPAAAPADLESLASKVGWRGIAAPPPSRTPNDVFERICVINLDRRADRWRRMRGRLARAGIRAERVAALDGMAPEIRAAHAAYAARPLAEHPAGVRRVESSRQFYRDHDSQSARLAFEEQRAGRKAIASPGALAYLMTWQGILEQALDDGIGTLLVLDDDAAFHRDFEALFPAACRDLPPDWLMLQLGTLQYDWNAEAIQPAGRHLYRTGGTAIGSHAVGLRFEALPFLLEAVRRRDMPFDIGALSAATHAFRERCFVVTPHAAIQDLRDSDIGTSGFQKSRSLEVAARTYRWHLPDYDLNSDGDAS
jgi:GR25 family glycosyltransferase involved in LPS biosynthesis